MVYSGIYWKSYILKQFKNSNKIMNLKSNKSFIFDTQITTHAIHLTKSNAIEILNDAKLFFDMQQFVYSFYKLDKICTVYDVYNIESEVLGQKIKYFKNDLPTVDIKEPFIKNKSDISKIKNLNFEGSSRARFVLELIDIYKDNIGKDFKPRFCAPFSLAANIRGFANLISDIYDDKKFVKELFKIINYEILAPWITKQRKKAGSNDLIASGADAWVAIPNINLAIIEDIIIPSYEELKALVGNIYLSLLGGARFLKRPLDYLKIQKILNPFVVKGTDFDIEILGPEFYKDFAVKNNMDLLFGIEANFILENSVEVIMDRINNYINIGLITGKNLTLYLNDIPADISVDKLKNIFNEIRKIQNHMQLSNNILII
jgi:hypothetical protein